MSTNSVKPSRRSHDHRACVRQALANAEAACLEGPELSGLRRDVLMVIWRQHKPVSAYDILNRLNETGRKLAPPSIYRALAFLMRRNLVHRVESHNGYIGCAHATSTHHACLLICDRCQDVTEIPMAALHKQLSQTAASHDFETTATTVELRGICGRCKVTSAKGQTA